MAGKTHGTRTSERMNEALKRDIFGFIARQTKATQDFRQAIYLHPDGKIGHWVRNPYSSEAYWVSDLTGGSTFEPGSTVMLASFSGRRGEGIVGRSPAGFGGAAISEVTLPPSVTPTTTPPVDALEQGYYLGWSYYCDGGGYVWTACMHHRLRYLAGPVFVDGTVALRVGRYSMADLAGGVDIPIDGYDIDDFAGGNGGAEVFRLDSDPLSSLSQSFRTVSIIQSGGYVFVVTVEIGETTYTVHLMTDSGTLIATDTFTGRAWVSTPEALGQHSAICSNIDGNFYFAHPIGAGAEEFRFCRRSLADASVVDFIDIDFSIEASVYAGIAPIPGAPGLRVFRNADDSSTQAYKDFDTDFSALSAWVTMDFGADNHFGLFAPNMVVPRTSGFAVLGVNVSTDPGVFLVDLNGDFVSEVGDHAPARPPIFPAASGSFVFIGTAVTGEFALWRMLSDGTMA